jgi:hypothetical protein
MGIEHISVQRSRGYAIAFCVNIFELRQGGAVVARQAHNLKVGGANPPPDSIRIKQRPLRGVAQTTPLEKPSDFAI